MNAQLKERLSALRVDAPAELEAIQLDRIAVALREPPVAVPPFRTGRLRRRLASLATGAALVVLPGAAAIAAEGAVPGDALYPVKRATEMVRSWFDPAVVADHRIDELEAVIDRGAPRDEIIDRLRDATVAVEQLADPSITDRLHRVRDTVVEKEATDDAARQPPSDTHPTPTRDDEPPRDTATTTSSLVPRDRPAETTDTSSEGDADRPFDEPATDEPRPDEPPPADRPPGDDRRGD